jgi:hypothetical protein
MPHLLDLPNELLFDIIQALVVSNSRNSNRTLVNLCLVNQRLSELARIELYRQFSATGQRRNIYVREFLGLLKREPYLASRVESTTLLPKELTSDHSRFFWRWAGSGYIGEDVNDESSVKTEVGPVVELLHQLRDLKSLSVEINHLEELMRISSSPFPALMSLTIAKPLRDNRGARWLPVDFIATLLGAAPRLQRLEIQGGGVTTMAPIDFSHGAWSDHEKCRLLNDNTNNIKSSLEELVFVDCNLDGEWLSWLLQTAAPSLKRFKYASKVPYMFETMKSLVVALKVVRNTLTELTIDDNVGNDHTDFYGHGRAAGNLAQFTALKKLRATYRTLLNVDEIISLPPQLETLEVTTIEEWGDIVRLLYEDMIAAVKGSSLRKLRLVLRFIGDRMAMDESPVVSSREALNKICGEHAVRLELSVSGRPRPRHWPLVYGVNGFTFV